MSRRRKDFAQRRLELIGSLDLLETALQKFRETKQIHWLRVVASQLRALIIYKEKSTNFKHPLLIDLGREKGISPNVYVSRVAKYHALELERTDDLKPVFGFGEKMICLSDEGFHDKMLLREAITLPYVIMRGKGHSLEQIIRMIADTEGSHYDPERPEELDTLDKFEIWGISSPYMAVYELGEVVLALGKQLIQMTER